MSVSQLNTRGRIMPQELLLALEGMVEPFLSKWTEHMRRAGYLRHTTAKKEDCDLSFQGVMGPLWAELRAGGEIGDFSSLVQRRDGWAGEVLAMCRRHRFRGVTAEMFIGCFKTLVHSVEDLLREMDAPPGRTLAALNILRRYTDAMETLLVGDWTSLSQQEAFSELDAANRQLTLQKNKFENIFATTSDMVLVTDAEGLVEEANEAARPFLSGLSKKRSMVWEALGIEGTTLSEILDRFPPGIAHEINVRGSFLEMRISSLASVSLASSNYLFLLTDITGHVCYRATLEERVRERTAELEQKTVRLEEMNITLRNVLGTIESERREYHESIAHAVETTLLPTLKHVQSSNDPAVRRGYTGLLTDQLMHLCDGASGRTDGRMLSLTPTEIKICQFIQSGRRNKEIADSLNLSIETIQSHRRNIRRKLSLRGREVNLFTFLQAKA